MKKRLSRLVLLPLAGLGLCLPTAAHAGDVGATGDRIAAEIAQDSGRPAADFRGYAMRLAKTLTGLSPEVQVRVLKEHAGVIDGSSGSPTGGGGSASQAEQDALDFMNSSPPPSSFDLKDALKDASPLSVGGIAQAMESGLLDSNDLKAVLKANEPLVDSTLTSAIQGVGGLASGDLRDVLKGNVPFSQVIYDQIAGGQGNLDAGDRADVIAAHHGAAETTAP